jgi:hypothetical protein
MPDGTITFSPGERKVNGGVRKGFDAWDEPGVSSGTTSDRLADVRLGHKRTYALQQSMSALHPIATAKADMPQMIMSVYP